MLAVADRLQGSLAMSIGPKEERLSSCHFSQVDIAIIMEGLHLTFKYLCPFTFPQNPFLRPRSRSSAGRFCIADGKSSCDIVLLQGHHSIKAGEETNWGHNLGPIQGLLTEACPYKSQEYSHIWAPGLPSPLFWLTWIREPIPHGNSHLKVRRLKVNTSRLF